MAKRYYMIVDGYNIMYSWQDLKETMAIDLELARKSLIDTMAEYAKSSGEEVMVVFDAYVAKGKRTYAETKGIQVIFTEENETADQYIERLVDRIGRRSRRNEIRVASSDGMIQNIVLGRGATRVSAGELRQIVKDQKEENKRISKRLKKEIDKNLVTIDNENLEKINEYIKKLKNKEDTGPESR